jgi:hypothetical protein
MATAGTIIAAALRLIGAKAPREPLTAAEAADGLEALNMLLDSWSTSNLLVPALTETRYPAATQAVALPNRPMRVLDSYLRLGNLDFPVTAITRDQYQALPLKTMSARPGALWWDQLYPASSVYLYPVPDQAYTLCLQTWERLSQLAGPSATVTLPGEFSRALKFNLAVDLAPEWGAAASAPLAAVAAVAKESKEALLRYNGMAVPTLASDMVGGLPGTFGAGHFDWRTGL